jgi:hypothetical protein
MNTREPARSRPGAEVLEPRRMLSAVVENGVLIVTGTPVNDYINIFEVRGDTIVTPYYSVNVFTSGGSEFLRIPPEGIRSVTVRALGGNDTVNVELAPRIPDNFPLRLPTVLDGGTGDDELCYFSNPSLLYS